MAKRRSKNKFVSHYCCRLRGRSFVDYWTDGACQVGRIDLICELKLKIEVTEVNWKDWS
jgi:hypothetical protein